MARRLQVDTGIPTVAPRVTAAPVDTYVQPVANQKLAQLSQALGQLGGSVSRFGGVVGQVLDEKHQTEGSLAGQAAAEQIRKNGTTLAEATRKGLIPASGNPFYMAGFHEQLGQVMADNYYGELKSYVSQHEGLQESTDLKDYDKVAADFKQKWMTEHIGDDKTNQFFDTGFAFRSGAYDQRSRQEFAGGIEEKVLKQGNQATHQQTVQAIQDAIQQNHLDAVPASLNQMLEDHKAQGRNIAVDLRTVAQGVHDAAVADPANANKILDLLKDIKGKLGPLSTTDYGMALVEQAKNTVAEKTQRQYTVDAEHAAANKSAGVADILGQFNDALGKAGDKAHTVDITPYRTAMNKVAPEHVAMLDQIQDGFVAHEFKEDPHIADDLLVRLYTKDAGESGYVDMPTIGRAFGNHEISKATFLTMSAELEKRDKASAEKTIFKDPVFLKGYDAVGKLWANELFDSQENKDKAASAQIEFTAAYIREFGGKTGPEFDAQKTAFLAKQIGHEMQDKGTKKQGDTFSKVPTAQLDGPQRANPKTTVVITPSKRSGMQHELTEWVGGRANRMSDASISTLLQYGVKPDKASIQQFLYQQKLLHDTGQRPPQ